MHHTSVHPSDASSSARPAISDADPIPPRKRWRWRVKTPLLVCLLALAASAVSGGGYLAFAAGTSSTPVQQFSYDAANCHTDPVLPDTSGSKQQYADYLTNVIAPRYHLEAAVLLWQVNQESGFNPNALSPAGAMGIAQFMPATAAAYHLDPWDPWQALDGMARYDLDSLRAFWDWSHTIATRFGGNRNAYAWGLALAAYNAGGGATSKAAAWADGRNWNRGPWTWLWWFGESNQTFYYVPDILGCEAPGTQLPVTALVEDVPQYVATGYDSQAQFEEWNGYTCGPATMTAILRAYGAKTRIGTIFDLLYYPQFGIQGIDKQGLHGPDGFVLLLQQYYPSWYTIAYNGKGGYLSLAHLERIVDAGYPVAVDLWNDGSFWPTLSQGHWLTVVGFTDTNVLVRDSSTFHLDSQLTRDLFTKLYTGLAAPVLPVGLSLPA